MCLMSEVPLYPPRTHPVPCTQTRHSYPRQRIKGHADEAMPPGELESKEFLYCCSAAAEAAAKPASRCRDSGEGFTAPGRDTVLDTLGDVSDTRTRHSRPRSRPQF